MICRLSVQVNCSCYTKLCDLRSVSPMNSLLLKLQLGWLFDLPNFPAGLFFTQEQDADIDHAEYYKTIEVIQDQYCRLCVNCLRYQLQDVSYSDTTENTIKSLTGSTPRKMFLSEASKMLSFNEEIFRENESPIKTPHKLNNSKLFKNFYGY